MANARRKVLALVATSLAVATLSIGATSSPASASTGEDEWELVCLINNERVNRGIPALRMSPDLRLVARTWSGVMDLYDNLSHSPSLAGQLGFAQPWQRAGENVGYGYDVPSLHRAFMNSAGHRSNILDRDWEYVGVGVSGSSPSWTTQNFVSSTRQLYTLEDPYHSFHDVCSGNPFFDEIEWMASSGISQGFSNGTYRPNDVVTRQSMSAFMYRFAGSPQGDYPDPGFSDVRASTSPFYDEISWMATTGITNGYEDGTFRPSNRVSREAMSAFMYRFEGSPTVSSTSGPTFRDVPLDHAFADEIAWMASVGVTNGYQDDTYRPGAAVSRQAMSAFMKRLHEL